MAKFKFDWKQLLVAQGERIAVGVAGFLCLLMVVPMLWYTLFGPSSKAVVEDVNKPVAELSNRQKSANPETPDLPPASAEGNSVKMARKEISDPSAYQVVQFFTPVQRQDTSKRRNPDVYTPVESAVRVLAAQVKRYILSGKPDREEIMVLAGAADPAIAGPMAGENLKRLSQQYQGPRATPGAGQPRYQAPTAPSNIGAEGSRTDKAWKFVPIDQITDLKTDHLADTIQPTRMAMIVCSFPYRLQMEEFRNKLKLTTLKDVESETVELGTEVNKDQRSGFQFRSPNVERMEVDLNGKPVVVDGKPATWEPVKDAPYLELLRLNGARTEPDSPDVRALSVYGLVMQRVAAMGKDSYPKDLETSLPTLKTTLAELAKTNGPQIAKPKNLRLDNFDLYQSQPTEPTTGVKSPATGPITRPVTGSPRGDLNNSEENYPEYCLIRLIDVTVQPGKIYKYRLQVRMENPNYGKKDVASPEYATRTEPLTSEWFEIKQPVVVPSEYHLYTLDQAELDKPYFGQNFGVTPVKDRQAVFQIHKWIENAAPPNSGTFVPVGEWSVAERVLVFRGEYLNRMQRVEVPYWRHTMENFVLAVDNSAAAKKQRGIPVDFGPPLGGDPVLVDFEGGDMTYNRTTASTKGDKPETVRVSDKAGHETLILSPEGKLLAHDSWTDRKDAERVTRLGSWRQRISDVRTGKTSTGGGPADPFGPK